MSFFKHQKEFFTLKNNPDKAKKKYFLIRIIKNNGIKA